MRQRRSSSYVSDERHTGVSGRSQKKVVLVARTAQIQAAEKGEEASPQQSEFRPGRGPIDWLGGWRTGIVAPVLILLVAAAWRIYQQFTAWTKGIDASSHDFTIYYRIPLIVELLGVTAFTLGWWGWLLRTGRTIAQRIWHNQDASWHQTAVRDTAFTPSHIPMFYLFFPLGIAMTIGTYLYGRTRLPKVYGVEKGFPWSFALLIAASVTEMMQVAMNEWGHSLWIPEEIFAVPFHWPFVFYGWLAGGIFALWAESLIRLLAIEDEVVAAGEPGAKEVVA